MSADQTKSLSAAYSIPLLVIGLCVIAIAVLVPQTQANRKLAGDREQLRRDLAHIDAQAAVNAEFLGRVGTDPELTERLAQRQLKKVREGTEVLNRPAAAATNAVSQMLAVPAPDPVPPPVEPDGVAGLICQDNRHELGALGVGLFLAAVGLVIGPSEISNTADSPAD